MNSSIDFLKIAERLELLFSYYRAIQLVDEPSLKKEVLGYYRTLYGFEKCSNCRNTLLPEFLKMKKEYPQKIQEKMAENAKKYTLKPEHKFIRFFGEGTAYTNDTLTDAIVEKYLKKYPKKIDLFDVNESASIENAKVQKIEPKEEVKPNLFEAKEEVKAEEQATEGKEEPIEEAKTSKKGKK